MDKGVKVLAWVFGTLLALMGLWVGSISLTYDEANRTLVPISVTDEINAAIEKERDKCVEIIKNRCQWIGKGIECSMLTDAC